MNNLFINLPEAVQNEVKDTLKAFRRVEVSFYNGEYHVETGSFLLANYPADFKAIGTFTDSEIFTEDERILNYINSFHEYPVQYEGRRDYRWLKALTWNDEVVFNADHELTVKQ